MRSRRPRAKCPFAANAQPLLLVKILAVELAIQIEGSGRVIFEDGTPLRVNYDSHNGYPYSAIGRASSSAISFRSKSRDGIDANFLPP